MHCLDQAIGYPSCQPLRRQGAIEEDGVQSLKESVVVITGAGRGLGAATARVLADAGATVIAADIDGPAVEALAADLQEEGGVAEARLVDLCDETMAEGVIQGVVDAY